MKASELIKELEKQINRGGDREVCWFNYVESYTETITHIGSNETYCADDCIIITDGEYSRD